MCHPHLVLPQPPTFLCADKDSCEALQTSDIDNPFDISHESPYNYVADKAYLSAAKSANKTATETCPADHPACGLQTTLREAKGKTCAQCYTRFRYTADIGAIYWRVFQIKKSCLAAGEACRNRTGCWCTTEGPKYYTGAEMGDDGLPKKGTENDDLCSPWAKAVCRRKAYKCVHKAADYVITTFQDYDINFCSLGTDDPECSGCVACTDPACLQVCACTRTRARSLSLPPSPSPSLPLPLPFPFPLPLPPSLPPSPLCPINLCTPSRCSQSSPASTNPKLQTPNREAGDPRV